MWCLPSRLHHCPPVHSSVASVLISLSRRKSRLESKSDAYSTIRTPFNDGAVRCTHATHDTPSNIETRPPSSSSSPSSQTRQCLMPICSTHLKQFPSQILLSVFLSSIPDRVRVMCECVCVCPKSVSTSEFIYAKFAGRHEVAEGGMATSHCIRMYGAGKYEKFKLVK